MLVILTWQDTTTDRHLLPADLGPSRPTGSRREGAVQVDQDHHRRLPHDAHDRVTAFLTLAKARSVTSAIFIMVVCSVCSFAMRVHMSLAQVTCSSSSGSTRSTARRSASF